jgi:ABC-2 type transport system ATP-binding protein
VAVDTPDNLAARLRGAETLYVQVDAAGADAQSVLAAVPGVTRVAPADMRTGSGAFEVVAEQGRDIRRDVSREVVTRGWGLLELRPMRVSLEEVFLQVTTEEKPTEEKPGDPGGPVLSDGAVRAEGEDSARVEGEAPHA